MLPGAYIQRVLDQYSEKVDQRRQRVDRLTAMLLKKHPELQRARQELSAAKRKSISHRLGEDITPSEDRIEIAEEYYKQLFNEAIKESGLTPEDFIIQEDCTVCHDTGYVGDEKKYYCPCVLNHVSAMMLQSANLHSNKTFEQFDSSLFPDDHTKANMSQRELMQRLRKIAERWIEAFPKNDKKQMLIIGGTGLGKSFLLNCMAHAVIGRGHSALLMTSNGINEAAFKSINERSDMLETLRSTELLLIDDLGAEPIYNNITVKAFFSVIDFRIEHGLHTVIATNLELSDIEQTYGQRMFSRLTHKQNTAIYRLSGVDVRRL